MENEKNPSITVNFLLNIILKISSFIFPMITFPYISRVLGAEYYGRVQLATSTVSYFWLAAQLGLPTYGIRACAIVRNDKEKLSRTTHELLIINLSAMLISCLAFMVVINTVPKFSKEHLLYMVAGTNIVFGSIGMEWLYGGLEQYRYIAVRSLAFKVVSIVAMFLMVHQPQDYVIYAGISVFASVGSNILNVFQARKYIHFRYLGQYRVVQHLKPVLIFFGMNCVSLIYTGMDTVMLGFMVSDTAVGYYSAAVKIKNVLVGLITALGTVLLPRVSCYIEQNKMDDFWAVIRKSLRFTLCAAVPLSVYFSVYAKNGIFLLSGDGYQGAVLPMIIIMPTLIFIGLGSVLGVQTLVPMGKENKVFISYILGAVVDLILNLLLIPVLHEAGAAIGTLVAEIAVCGYQAYILRKIQPGKFFSEGLGNIIIAALLGCASSFWVHWLPLGDFWILAISACLFFGVYALYLYWRKDEFILELKQKAITMLKLKHNYK